jgi:tetratricopeptide (TPR) repeat protein
VARTKTYPRHSPSALRGQACAGLLLAWCVFSVPSFAAQAQSGAPAAAELEEALAQARSHHAADALATATRLTDAHPEYAQGWKLKGSLLEDAGQTAQAETCYERGLQLSPADTDLLFKVGAYRLQTGNAAQAKVLLERAAALAPTDADTLFYLAQAYHLDGEDEKALSTMRHCVELDRNNALALETYGALLASTGDSAAGLVQLQAAAQLDPTLDRLDYDFAYANLHSENLDVALHYVEQAARKHPEDQRTLALLAEVSVRLGRWSQARQAFSALLVKHPDDRDTLLGLGQCELSLKDYAESVKTLQHLLQVDPANALAHFYLARDYTALGRPADAAHETELHRQFLQRAGSLIPEDERQVERATLLEARGLLQAGKEEQAVALFRTPAKGHTVTPGMPDMLVGVSYLYMGRAEDARRMLRRSLAIEPAVRQAHTYLGVLALREGDLAEAEQQFTAELAIDARSKLATAELGEVRYRQGRWDEAVDQLVRSHTVDPRLLCLLSDAYYRLGRTHEGDLTAELAASYAKDQPEERARLGAMLKAQHRDEIARKLQL